MIGPRFVATRSFGYAVGGVALIMLLAAMTGVIGTTAQYIALCTPLVLVPIGVDLCIKTTVSLLNRGCRYARQSSSVSDGTNGPDQEIDAESKRLSAMLSTMRANEEACAKAYAARRKSLDDLVRAKSLRVQAEIAVLRHEAIPKPWPDACGKAVSEP